LGVGFIRGIGLRIEHWTPVLLTNMRLTLAPIFVSHDMGAPFLPEVPKAEQLRRRVTDHEHIAQAVVAQRQVCNSKRADSFAPARRRIRARRRIPMKD
jgi:hypothetical protein